MEKKVPAEADQAMRFVQPLTLPPDLESLCVTRFDELVSTGQLIYESSTAATIEDQGFKVNPLKGSWHFTGIPARS